MTVSTNIGWVLSRVIRGSARGNIRPRCEVQSVDEIRAIRVVMFARATINVRIDQ
jgi:hypothetical protein